MTFFVKIHRNIKINILIIINRDHQGTSRQGGLTLKVLKTRGGVNSSDLMDNFWRSPQNFV
jgi:hypothetical protein